jgi:hypothetical protein
MIASHKGEIPFAILLLPFLAGIGFRGLFSCISFYRIFYGHIIGTDRSVCQPEPIL